RFGADFVGLNFYPGSPRCISEAQARPILQAIAYATPAGLFVNETWDRIRESVLRLGLNAVQVHADQLPPSPFNQLLFSSLPAFSVRDASSLTVVTQFLQRCHF